MDDTATTRMHTGSEADQFTYRPLSKLAIVCLVLGLLSAVAFVNPALWIVPCIAVAVGIAAWRSTSRGESAGLWFAVSGVVVATFLGACAVAYHQVRLSTLKSSTRDYAQSWLQMVDRGEVDKAFQYLLATKYDIKPPRKTYDEYYADDPRRLDARDAMLAIGSIRDLVAFDGELTLLRSHVNRCHAKSASVLHRFRFVYDDQGQQKEIFIDVQLIGELTKAKNTMEWYVGDVQADEAASN